MAQITFSMEIIMFNINEKNIINKKRNEGNFHLEEKLILPENDHKTNYTRISNLLVSRLSR